MHGLHNTCYFEGKKTLMQYFYCICSWVFVCRNVHFFLRRFVNCFSGKALANFFVTGVLNPPQHAPTWIAYTNIQVPGER